mmetsp:Transcript_9556/g.9167  ORF Transcript_9556/g.9167 Transcript_9556/m.9167 type:complete len:136 (-) Transcript_9556:1834-2241(-)
MKNLTFFIHQVIKQFQTVMQEAGAIQNISKDTVESLGFIFTLEVVDHKLVEALADFLISVSKKKKNNYEIVVQYFEGKYLQMIGTLNEKLASIPQKVDQEKLKFSPSKSNHEPSAFEEEKSAFMQIDSSMQMMKQ